MAQIGSLCCGFGGPCVFFGKMERICYTEEKETGLNRRLRAMP